MSSGCVSDVCVRVCVCARGCACTGGAIPARIGLFWGQERVGGAEGEGGKKRRHLCEKKKAQRKGGEKDLRRAQHRAIEDFDDSEQRFMLRCALTGPKVGVRLDELPERELAGSPVAR